MEEVPEWVGVMEVLTVWGEAGVMEVPMVLGEAGVQGLNRESMDPVGAQAGMEPGTLDGVVQTVIVRGIDGPTGNQSFMTTI